MEERRRLSLKGFIILGVIVGLLFGVLLILMIPNPPKREEEKKKEKKVSIVDQVTKKLEGKEESEFIKWINENYPDSLNKLQSTLEKEEYSTSMWHDITGYSYIVLKDLYQDKYDSMNNIKILEKDTKSIGFVGDVSLADNWHIIPKYDSRGGITGILSDDILNIMRNEDLMIANSEFTVSNRGSAMSGKVYTFRAKPERLKIYEEMGVDMVTLANNHVYDFGGEAFLDMLDYLDEYKIPHIGAGRNIEEAKRPYYYIIGGYKFAFVNATRAEKYILTPEATESSGGVFRCYDPTALIEEIKELKKESDYVIAILHYGTEGSHQLEEAQVSSSHAYIDAGADVVVGHHAHTLQGVEFYNHKPIIYNLGNFIFSHDLDDTAIFQIDIKERGKLEYTIIPALQKDCYTDTLIGEGKQRVINDINSWSINAHLDEEGKILENE